MVFSLCSAVSEAQQAKLNDNYNSGFGQFPLYLIAQLTRKTFRFKIMNNNKYPANGDLSTFNDRIASMRPSGMSDDEWNYILNTNPYQTAIRKESNWDRFISNLGFTSKYDAFNAERLQNFQNYVSQSVERWRQDKYNSPANQAELMRQAGINPDLSNNINPSASTGDPNSLAPMSDLSDVLQGDDYKFGDIVSIGLSALSTVCQIGNGLFDMGKRKMELRNLDAETTKGIFDFTESFANRTVPDESTIPEFEQYLKQGYTPQEAFSFIMDNTIDAAAKEAKDGTPWFRNKRNARLFAKSLSEYKQSSNYKAVKNRAFSAYVDSFENKVFDQEELNSVMRQYDDFISMINEFYYPTMYADYQLYLDDARTMLEQNETLRAQYGLQKKVVSKEEGILDERYATESSRLAYDKGHFDQAVTTLAIELAQINAKKAIADKVSAKLGVNDKDKDKDGKSKDIDDVGVLELMFWNSVLNKMNSDVIGEATRLGLDVGKFAIGGVKSFIRPKPRTIINNIVR